MGEFDGAVLSIRDDKDDIYFRKQVAEKPYLLKLVSIRSRENCDRIRFYGHPESLPEVIQSFEEFYFIFWDHLMNGRLKSILILTIPT